VKPPPETRGLGCFFGQKKVRENFEVAQSEKGATPLPREKPSPQKKKKQKLAQIKTRGKTLATWVYLQNGGVTGRLVPPILGGVRPPKGVSWYMGWAKQGGGERRCGPPGGKKNPEPCEGGPKRRVFPGKKKSSPGKTKLSQSGGCNKGNRLEKIPCEKKTPILLTKRGDPKTKCSGLSNPPKKG